MAEGGGKIGCGAGGGAGIVMERAYQQFGHFAEGMMVEQVGAVRDELAERSGAATDKPIRIPRSRNPGGVYSDASGGVMTGEYRISP